MVALEGLGEVRLVELAGLPLPDAELGRIFLQTLDEPVAHGVGGLEADAAAIGALAEREHEDEALGVGHPSLAGQPARAEDPVGEFARLLEYKCAERGRTLVKVGRFYPSSKTCSGCGHRLDALPLSVRSWDCPACGAHHDRDVNAARNILAEGKRILSNTEGTAGHAGTVAAVPA